MSTTDTATLLVSCPDRKGIVASLAQVLYGHGANILDSDQHSDVVAGKFFQRVRFDWSEARTDLTSIQAAVAELAARFDMTWRLAIADERRKTAIFVSRFDHCLYDLLWRHRAAELATDLAMIISNHPDLEEVADQFGVDFHHLPVSKETKPEAEATALELCRAADVDLIVLARYMQILSESFVDTFPGVIINIHHSFLPAFIGGRPYHQAYARGVKLVGATAHYVTADLDEGPIIDQDVVRCSHRDSVADLTRKGRDLEKVVLARAVRCHLEDRVLICGNKTVVFD
ncbi:MAG: formyltetrahydrofolate deformylase [Acidobacteriota bacterium]|nr:formyltetrahydrofolate deformylase [Acidobacteriota bacterium]